MLLGHQEDVQDTLQETFLKCWRARALVPRLHNLRAWIFRIGLNAAKDLQRSAWRRRVRPMSLSFSCETHPSTPAADRVIHAETLERLRAALVCLRPEEQQVFLCRQNGDLTYEEIARLVRRPVGTVKTQMRSALHKLRAVLH
jgi:RNA polymerase sigma-70 factor (ECF subfamily)